MRILVAPNAFKNALSAVAAAESICAGFTASKLSCSCESFPIGDGGDGTAHLLVSFLKGEWIHVFAQDPLGRNIDSQFGWVESGATAVIEMAAASGIRLLNNNELDPLSASSFGTGELIKAALDRGAKKIILAMGGSATVDGASGMLQAVGLRFLDRQGVDLKNIPAMLFEADRIDVSALDARLSSSEIVVLCDVQNRLLGKDGAAYVFGPQKGATRNDVIELDNRLAHFARLSQLATGKDMNAMDGGGTAGGAAAGLHAFVDARLVNGIEYFLDLTRFDEALSRCDCVITGEGSIDMQTLQGKGPYGVARRARLHNIPVIAMAGRIEETNDQQVHALFDILLPISNGVTDMGTALATTADNLFRTAFETGNLLALEKR